MSLDIQYIVIQRYSSTLNALMEPIRSLAPIPGSPSGGWPCLIYRKKSTTLNVFEEQQGRATKDTMIVCSVKSLTAGVQEKDIVTLPDGTFATVQLVRGPYSDGYQLDLEAGTQI